MGGAGERGFCSKEAAWWGSFLAGWVSGKAARSLWELSRVLNGTRQQRAPSELSWVLNGAVLEPGTGKAVGQCWGLTGKILPDDPLSKDRVPGWKDRSEGPLALDPTVISGIWERDSLFPVSFPLPPFLTTLLLVWR